MEEQGKTEAKLVNSPAETTYQVPTTIPRPVEAASGIDVTISPWRMNLRKTSSSLNLRE